MSLVRPDQGVSWRLGMAFQYRAGTRPVVAVYVGLFPTDAHGRPSCPSGRRQAPSSVSAGHGRSACSVSLIRSSSDEGDIVLEPVLRVRDRRRYGIFRDDENPEAHSAASNQPSESSSETGFFFTTSMKCGTSVSAQIRDSPDSSSRLQTNVVL